MMDVYSQKPQTASVGLHRGGVNNLHVHVCEDGVPLTHIQERHFNKSSRFVIRMCKHKKT